MRTLFNLTADPDRGRSDVDAYLLLDGEKINFELKSTTSGSVSTVRDFGPDHIKKWRNELHWIFAFYDASGSDLQYCVYASPADMEPWIAEKERYIGTDIALADHLPAQVSASQIKEIFGDKAVYSRDDAFRVMKKQWTSAQYTLAADRLPGYSVQRMAQILAMSRGEDPAVGTVEEVISLFGERDVYSVDEARALLGRQWPRWRYAAERDVELGYSLDRMTEILRERARYVINRGSTLNNPHIEASFFDRFERITDEPAAKLRELVKDYLKASATDVATA